VQNNKRSFRNNRKRTRIENFEIEVDGRKRYLRCHAISRFIRDILNAEAGTL